MNRRQTADMEPYRDLTGITVFVSKEELTKHFVDRAAYHEGRAKHYGQLLGNLPHDPRELQVARPAAEHLEAIDAATKALAEDQEAEPYRMTGYAEPVPKGYRDPGTEYRERLEYTRKEHLRKAQTNDWLSKHLADEPFFELTVEQTLRFGLTQFPL